MTPTDGETRTLSQRLRPLDLALVGRGCDPSEPALRALALARWVRTSDHWRLYPDLAENARFIDIETEGLAAEDPITIVGVSDGCETSVLVRGVDLTRERLARALDGAGLIVTFNGISFDLPRLRAAFPGLPCWELPHFDLAVEGRRVGLRGGLKRVERRLGYTRPRTVRGVDGAQAVRLWRDHQRGDANALRRLVRYCRADVKSLGYLAERVYARLAKQAEASAASDGWIARPSA